MYVCTYVCMYACMYACMYVLSSDNLSVPACHCIRRQQPLLSVNTVPTSPYPHLFLPSPAVRHTLRPPSRPSLTHDHQPTTPCTFFRSLFTHTPFTPTTSKAHQLISLPISVHSLPCTLSVCPRSLMRMAYIPSVLNQASLLKPCL